MMTVKAIALDLVLSLEFLLEHLPLFLQIFARGQKVSRYDLQFDKEGIHKSFFLCFLPIFHEIIEIASRNFLEAFSLMVKLQQEQINKNLIQPNFQ